MSGLTLEEQEFNLSISADDPNTWYCYTDYIKWQRKLESIGATFVRNGTNGVGKYYTLDAKQVSFRKGKVELSPEEKERRAKVMKEVRSRNQ